MSERLEVVAALIRRGGRTLVTRRVKRDALGPLWEFPGGRVEPGETEPEALARELREELGVAARVGEKLLETAHDYPHMKVRLHFYRAEIEGEPEGMEGQPLLWADRDELAVLDFPEADRAFLEFLS